MAMTESIYDELLSTSKHENDIRTNYDKIDDCMIRKIFPSHVEYENPKLSNKILLTGSINKYTVPDNLFNMEFSKKTNDLLTYINWDNIVAAGGAIVNILTQPSETKLNDIDLFVYGLNLEQTKSKMDHIVDAIKRKSTDMNYETRTYMNNNVVNIYVFDTRKILQVQIILRLYETLTHVLVGFDVDCCCVGFDGKYIVTTQRGFKSLKYRINVASIHRRSPSYENRLIKYSLRGFDVITDFEYEKKYNKMFFMSSNNNGFTRLLEQELITL